MKLRIKILFFSVIALAFFYSAVYIFMIFKGRAIIISRLRDLTGRNISLGYFDLTPPFNLEIKNLNIDGLGKIDDVFVSVSIPYLLTGNIALNNLKITKPDITFTRAPKPAEPAGTQVPGQIAVERLASPAPEKPEKKRPLRLICKRLNIKDGKVSFVDHAVSDEGVMITVKDINFSLSNLHTFPLSGIANFELSARIPWNEGKEEGKIAAEGWLNLFKKDIQATLKIEDIDGVYLYPYYSQWVDLEKARIESAKLKFSADIQGLNNNVSAECRLELTDIVRSLRPEEESAEKAERIADAVLDMFKAVDQGRVVLDFTIRTKMDRPEFGMGNIKTAVEQKLAQARGPGGVKPENILLLPVKIIEGTVRGATDISRAVIDGTFAVGKELKDAVEGTFKRERKVD